MAREFEVKYRLTPDAMADIRLKYGPFRTIAMETTYYDTPSGAFSPKRWTLRRRFENGVSVCTLKTPRADGGKNEWEVLAPDIASAIPLLVDAGAPGELTQYAREGFTELCAARFTRQAADIRFGASLLELALDEGLLLGGGKQMDLLELEAEVKDGSDQDAVAFGRYLTLTYSLRPEPESKFKRARTLAREGR